MLELWVDRKRSSSAREENGGNGSPGDGFEARRRKSKA